MNYSKKRSDSKLEKEIESLKKTLLEKEEKILGLQIELEELKGKGNNNGPKRRK